MSPDSKFGLTSTKTTAHDLVSTQSCETNPKLHADRMLITCFASKFDLRITCLPPLLRILPPSPPAPDSSASPELPVSTNSSSSGSLFDPGNSKLDGKVAPSPANSSRDSYFPPSRPVPAARDLVLVGLKSSPPPPPRALTVQVIRVGEGFELGEFVGDLFVEIERGLWRDGVRDRVMISRGEEGRGVQSHIGERFMFAGVYLSSSVLG